MIDAILDTSDKIRDYLQPYADEISQTGFSCEWSINNRPEYSDFKIMYKDEYFGRIYVRFIYDSENIRRPDDVMIVFLTKITMTTKTSFTKTSVKNVCDIKTNISRTYSVKEIDKIKKWLILLFKQYKTMLAKKRKYEMDVDFE